MSTQLAGLLIAIMFCCGFAYGMWYAESKIRTEQAVLTKGRISISLPADPDIAEEALWLLRQLIRDVEVAKKAAEKKARS